MNDHLKLLKALNDPFEPQTIIPSGFVPYERKPVLIKAFIGFQQLHDSLAQKGEWIIVLASCESQAKKLISSVCDHFIIHDLDLTVERPK